jgi:uncharacterized membrane protein
MEDTNEPQGEMEERPESAASEEKPAREFDRALILVMLIIAAYTALFTTLCLLRYANFRASNLDTAIFNQAIWLMSRFKEPFSTIRGTNLFGDHFAPILVLLVPIYWIRGSVPGLLTLQTVVLALGALPLYLLARDKIKSRPVAVAVAVAYLAYPALQHLNLFDFHPEALGVTLLLFAMLAIDRRKFAWFYACAAGAAFCKEDMVLAVLVLGLIVYFLYDRRAGKIVSIASFFYFLAAVLVLIPAFAPEGYQYSGRLGQFGKTPFEALKNMVLRPVRTFSILATRENLRYVFDLLLPVAFLCVFAPAYLLPALPAFLINIISDFQPQHTIGFQYTAGIIPFVFIGVVFGLRRIRTWAEGGFRARRVVGCLAVVLVLCALGASVYYGPSPLSDGWRTSAYSSDAHVDAIREGISLIPEDASVSAQVFLLAHLSEREELYMFPEPFVDLADPGYVESLGDGAKIVFPQTHEAGDEGKDGPGPKAPEYVALDRSTAAFPLPEDRKQYSRMLRRLSSKTGYETVYDSRGVLILKK